MRISMFDLNPQLKIIGDFYVIIIVRHSYDTTRKIKTRIP